ncbi:hypothetical protein BA195_08035 [Tenacibaculum soleae]|uniref:Alpha-galactosidase NEW3 domain-containing protein n=1 Tax=Tenacibaculum soleae TaxID=447689 RepID=A0A1B9XZ65_9FLAO|nr:hypothetical protein [Tenacibaculum soleae]OCK42847.1 hypothetical protein BA195_08035 [Tenacibaculum soleae]
MNKYLYIFIVVLFCLACAKEVKGDYLFTTPALLEENIKLNKKDSLIEFNKTIAIDSFSVEKTHKKYFNKTQNKAVLDTLIIGKQGVKSNKTQTDFVINKPKTILNPKQDLGIQFNTKELATVQDKNQTISFNELKKNDIHINIINKQNDYTTNSTYTVITQITNNKKTFKNISLEANLPKEWKIISISKIGRLQKGEKKLCFLTFYIPTQFKSGLSDAVLTLKKDESIIKKHNFTLNVNPNYSLEVFAMESPKQLQAGESINSNFVIKNNGNLAQKISLKTKNILKSKQEFFLPKDSTIIVTVSQKTNKKANSFRRIGTNLEVLNITGNKKYYVTNSVEVIPTSIKKKDPYFRYPIEASLNFNSLSTKDYHFSMLSAEVKGNGFLDINKNHRLDFIIRAPEKQNLKYFSIVDQYSFIYKYKNSTTIYLGDHAYDINRLGYGNRYGMGFKIDQNIKKWTLSTFYSKPRLFDYNNKPIYGVKAVYNKSDSLRIGVSLVKSEGNNYSYKNQIEQDGKGQIATFDYYYRNKGTYVEAEMSTSFSENNLDYASRLNFSQKFKNVSFNSNITYASKNYLGAISNSLQFSNSFAYYLNGFNFALGHAVSKLNRKLDPILYEVEPYYENFYATFGYRHNRKYNISFRFDKRIREDQLEPVNYKYQEYGFDYRFNYVGNSFTGSFGGRFAKTQNLLISNQDYRNTYTHNLNLSYRILRNLSLRTSINHTITNRYGYSGLKQNYYRYNFGANYNVSRFFRINANYNSGFSPEKSYRKRDYINLNINAKINNHHRLQLRANYFENPSELNNKQLQTFVKYTYSFGVGLKRMFDQGGIEGYVSCKDEKVNVKGIKIFTAGKTVITNKFGNFELNNLQLGKNFIYVDESSLPNNVVLAQKNPIEINVEKDKSNFLEIAFLKSSSLSGRLNLTNTGKVINKNLRSYVKISNNDFSYYAESDEKGFFKFKNIVPGTYDFKLIRFKNNNYIKTVKSTSITIKDDVRNQLNIDVEGKERKVRFIKNNLKVLYND